MVQPAGTVAEGGLEKLMNARANRMGVKEVIQYDSDLAAMPVTVALWKSNNGRLYNSEDQARYDSCTHRPCQQCGEPALKRYIYCDACLDARERERYFKMQEANPSEPLVYCLNDQQYYPGLDDLFDQWEGEDLPMVVNCNPMYAPRLEIGDFLSDVLPDDTDEEVPSELVEAAKVFNEAVKAYGKPLSWHPGKTRVRQELIVELATQLPTSNFLHSRDQAEQESSNDRN